MTERVSGAPASEDLSAQLAGERHRLVGLCARLSGDATIAEDLAQETLAEAWRLLTRLRQPEGLAAWLNAIARNICLRWTREHGRDLAHTISPVSPPDTDGEGDELDILPAEDGELTIALERGELISLLDRALALLPETTRAALIGAYVRELPQAELAIRLGLSEGALRLRLHRGRLALRHALEGDLRDEAAALGLALPSDPHEKRWHSTRIWCPFCGRYPLEYQLSDSGGDSFRCMGRRHCNGQIAGAIARVDTTGLASPKPRLARQCLTLDRYYRSILANDFGHCARCGTALAIYRITPSLPLLSLPPEYGVVLTCPTCGPYYDHASAWHLALDTPQAQRFWRRHPRMRALPPHQIEVGGAHALCTAFESVNDSARLVVISDPRTYRVLSVQNEGGEA